MYPYGTPAPSESLHHRHTADSALPPKFQLPSKTQSDLHGDKPSDMDTSWPPGGPVFTRIIHETFPVSDLKYVATTSQYVWILPIESENAMQLLHTGHGPGRRSMIKSRTIKYTGSKRERTNKLTGHHVASLPRFIAPAHASLLPVSYLFARTKGSSLRCMLHVRKKRIEERRPRIERPDHCIPLECTVPGGLRGDPVGLLPICHGIGWRSRTLSEHQTRAAQNGGVVLFGLL